MFVKPAQGVKVRHPETRRHIPETGIEIPDTDIFWARRLLDGDVVMVERPTVASNRINLRRREQVETKG